MARADGQSRSKADKTADATHGAVQSPEPQLGEVPYDALFHAITEATAVWRPLYDKRGAPHDMVFVAANDAFKQLFSIPDPVGRRVHKLTPALDERLSKVLEMCALAARAIRWSEKERWTSTQPTWKSHSRQRN